MLPSVAAIIAFSSAFSGGVVEPDTAGSFTLEVSASYASSSDGVVRSEGWVGLGIPLDRFFVPVVSDDAHSRRDANRSWVNTFAEDAEHEEPAPAETEPESAPAKPQPKPQPEATRPLTSAIALEVVERALALAGLASLPERLDSLERRSRSSAALPELRLRGARGTDESLRLTPTITDPYKYTQAGGVDYMFEVRLTWRFDRLLFSNAELGVERLRSQIWHAREAVIERSVRALLAWQKAMLVLGDGEADEEALFAAWLSEMEARARLDAMTGGWFSKRVAKKPDAG